MHEFLFFLFLYLLLRGLLRAFYALQASYPRRVTYYRDDDALAAFVYIGVAVIAFLRVL